ncbi:uncharacterized protein LOC107610542 [Arachis ipaensis]|uniref:uncharacterized protein LOC107610542 n=1 Tax=Arachis ipaensis TaxID=130454 RepID=UPI0007AFAA0D|nr:uncharacterized protein LOC107610542 [Arachis ipaensis]XP_025669886.1 uncharacterized protein LOC112769604 [Arachis hypogaea]
MRLNPEKCAFGVQGGKFLGFMLTSRGIEANPEKCEAILNMTSPKTIKEVQQLAGRVAALSRFLPSASSRSYHFFQTITKNKKFQWTEECEKAFAELKTILSSPPVLQRPEVELSEFDIQFQPRSALRAQILADFISEQTSDEHNKYWELHVDGASSRGGSGAGIILKEGDNVVAEQSLQFHFLASNNQAEYEALIAGLKLALNLQHHFSSVEHPQTNGQAEAANRVILQAIKRKLDNAKGEWAELIPEILWSYNTTIQTTMGETPFKLVYGSEALIPVEVGTPTIMTELYDEQHNTCIRNAELDLVEEDRDIAAIKQRAMKQLVARKHNSKVVPRAFSKDDLVLR